MEWKKNVNTNLGITLILIFAALFTIIDFYVIGSHIDGYPFNDISGNTVNSDANVDEKVNDENDKLLSEDEALKIGNDLFEKMGEYSIERGPKEFDSNEKIVGYIKNDDGSFSTVDNSNGLALYFKLDKDKLGLIATEDYIMDYCNINDFVLYNGEYYGISGDRGSNISYIDTKLEVIQNFNDSIVFNAISAYFTDFSYHEGLLSMEEAPKEYKTNTFRIVKEAGEWKISEFHEVY